MKITTFENSKVGDKVWSIDSGWGEIRARYGSVTYPLGVYFSNGEYRTYTLGGLYTEYDKTQSLFWDEIVAPNKPIPDLKVDTKVVVWRDEHTKYNRYFAGWCALTGLITVYTYGANSWSASGLSSWPNWELAE